MAELFSSLEVACPYCGQATTCHLDPTQREETLVIDCEVCCRPMKVSIGRGMDGEPTARVEAD